MSTSQSNRDTKGLLDTSVVIDYDLIKTQDLPVESTVSSVTMAELGVGPLVASDERVRAQRQTTLLWAQANWEPLPFDSTAADAYGLVYAATLVAGRSPRVRTADLMIASIAMANALPLYTRNVDDFSHLTDLIEVRGV